jgi:hypothetical protein
MRDQGEAAVPAVAGGTGPSIPLRHAPQMTKVTLISKAQEAHLATETGSQPLT